DRDGPDGAWPRLRLVSAWADAGAAMDLPALRARFPRARFQPKGLLATEGIVSVPIGDHHPLAVTSHWLELERDDGAVVPLWSAEPGDEGCVVLTTGHGLWRYRLRDRIRVTGRLHATPTIRFLGRQDRTSDLRGEKLSEPFVAAVLDRLGSTGFALLAPEGAGYVLYAEHPVDPGALDRALSDNPHYRWCVSVGQLAPVRVVRVGPEAGGRYLRAVAAGGRRLGDVKATRLEPTGGWSEVLVAPGSAPDL
ncbi:MAG: GH3 auxin-responsive promoter family protein, partial [Myxococcota bacterium]